MRSTDRVSAAKSHSETKKILVLEDDPTCLMILERIVLSIAPNAKIALIQDAEEALSMLRRGTKGSSGPFDLIIADVFLEGRKTGIDVWQAVQSLCPDTPLLVISSMSTPSFLASVGRDSISPPFLPKPLIIGEAKQVIEGLLSQATH